MTQREQHWENIYQSRDHREVGWYQVSPEISLRLLDQVGISPEQSVIEIGCGASGLVDRLIERGFRKITLVDLSQKALSIVRDRLGAHGDIPDYRADDVTRLVLGQSFDIWHDRAVFHFLTDEEDQQKYVAVLKQHLAPEGHAIIGTFSLNGPKSCSGLPVERYDKEKMQGVLGEDLVVLDSLTDVHVTPAGGEQEYNYFIISWRAGAKLRHYP